tara:strand:- start:229 stop:1119 length:891 start_codon:yes stop_codon:yes gene_type:complete
MLSSFFFWIINRKDETLGEDFRKAIALHILKRDVLLARATTTRPEKGLLKNRALLSFFLCPETARKRVVTKMDDTEVQKQINQMVEFIKQEAEEKANEIRVAAEEEFNIEKLQMVEVEKQKIKREYERKESLVSVKKKIERSTTGNAARIKVLIARDRMMEEVLNTAREKLGDVSKSPQYKQLLAGLIAQGAKKLQDSNCTIRCRKQDENVCKEAIALATERVHGLQPTLDARESLPPAPEISKDGKSCVGGVLVISSNGKTTCDNTLDARVRNTFEALMPRIRADIFGEDGAKIM